MSPLWLLSIGFVLLIVFINLTAAWIVMLMNNEEENDDGLHRGAYQEVHGSAAGSSSGSQSTGTFIAQSPGFITWSKPSGTGSYSINNSSYYGASQAMTVPGSTPGYAFGHGYSGYPVQQLYQGGVTWVSAGTIVPTEPKKKVKDEGIRVGEIVAYRCWPIKNGFLWSTAAARAWAPGEPMKAGENHLRDGLGVYAFKDMSRVIQNVDDVAGRVSGEGIAFGTVMLWGEIVEHEIGYRAEYAAIRSIEYVRGVAAGIWTPEYADSLRKLYKVEGK